MLDCAMDSGSLDYAIRESSKQCTLETFALLREIEQFTTQAREIQQRLSGNLLGLRQALTAGNVDIPERQRSPEERQPLPVDRSNKITPARVGLRLRLSALSQRYAEIDDYEKQSQPTDRTECSSKGNACATRAPSIATAASAIDGGTEEQSAIRTDRSPTGNRPIPAVQPDFDALNARPENVQEPQRQPTTQTDKAAPKLSSMRLRLAALSSRYSAIDSEPLGNG